jgi:hypothetical protein
VNVVSYVSFRAGSDGCIPVDSVFTPAITGSRDKADERRMERRAMRARSGILTFRTLTSVARFGRHSDGAFARRMVKSGLSENIISATHLIKSLSIDVVD